MQKCETKTVENILDRTNQPNLEKSDLVFQLTKTTSVDRNRFR